MKKQLLTMLGLALLLAQTAQSKGIEPRKEKYIREYMVLTGAARMGEQVVGMMLDSFKKSQPLVEDAFWDGLKKDMKVDELIEKIIPIYDKYYSEDDLKAMIEFYKSPTGLKMTRVSPQVVQESMVVGQEWGRDIGEKVGAKIAARKKNKEKSK